METAESPGPMLPELLSPSDLTSCQPVPSSSPSALLSFPQPALGRLESQHQLFFLNQRAFPQNQFHTLQNPRKNGKEGKGSRSKLTEPLKMATAVLSTELGTLLSLATWSKSTKAGPALSSTPHRHRHRGQHF